MTLPTPISFTAGTKAKASEVNANFDDIKTYCDANDTAIAGKQATITGAATTITSSNLTASRAVISNASGKVAVSAVTDTELGYVSGVTSAIQTQINSVNTNVATYLSGYINGLTLSNNGSDANNDIDIAIGVAMNSLNTQMLSLSSALTKRLDATFTAGTNQGMLDTGSKANSTWYHIYIISKAAGADADILASTSATVSGITLPATYIHARRIGAILTDGSGNILPFVQIGDVFYWNNPITDVSVTNLGATATLYTLSVPALSGITAIFTFSCFKSSNSIFLYFYSPLINDQIALNTSGRNYAATDSGTGNATGGQVEIVTSNGQIKAVSDTTNTSLWISTMGYKDLRGKN